MDLVLKKRLGLGMELMIMIVNLTIDYLHYEQALMHVWKGLIEWIQE
jgi:hypothetical protein